MLGLVVPTAEETKESHPDIYAESFAPLEWGGDVDLSRLTSDQFQTVYELSRAAYDEFLAKFSTAESRKAVSGTHAKWVEYLQALESDPRLQRSG